MGVENVEKCWYKKLFHSSAPSGKGRIRKIKGWKFQLNPFE
jgi:hypothetical protein